MYTKKKKIAMKNLTFKLKLITFLKYFADALYTPFLILFLSSVGYEGVKLGILLGIVPFGAIIGNILLSIFANNFKRNKIILSLLLLIHGIGLYFIIFANSNFILSIVATFLIAIANNPSFSLEEGITSLYIEKEHKNYSFTRMFGSIGYVVSLFLAFFLPKDFSFQIVFYVSGILFLILSACWIFLPQVEMNIKEKASIKEVIKNKHFIAYFIMYFLFFGAFNAFDYYIPEFVTSLSYSKNDWSLFYAFAVLTEIVAISIVGKFVKKKHYKTVLLCSLGFLLIRSALFAIPHLPKELVPVLIIIRGFGWGSFLAIHIKTLMTILDDNLKGTGILILCVGQGIVAAILNLLGSTIISKFSYNVFFIVIASFMFVSFIFYLVYNLKYKEKGIEKNEN